MKHQLRNRRYENERTMRKSPTTAEETFWAMVRNRGFGVKFRRQHRIGASILDFYCPEFGLAIELDGEAHQDERGKMADVARDERMKKLGITTVRIENSRVVYDPRAVERRLREIIAGLRGKTS